MTLTAVNRYVYTDAFGNAYLNSKDYRLVEPFSSYSNFDMSSGSITTIDHMQTACDQAVGVNWATISAVNMNISITFPSVSNEVNTTTTAAKRFFTAMLSSNFGAQRINVNTTTNSTTFTSWERSINSSGLSYSTNGNRRDQYVFATISPQSYSTFYYDRLTLRHKFMSFGWVMQPLNFNISTNRFSTAYSLFTSNSNGSTVTVGFRGNLNDVANTTAPTIFQTTSPTIVCTDSQSPTSTWITNLVLVDSLSPNYAIGMTDGNLLLARGSYTVGSVYELPPIGNNIATGDHNNNPNTDALNYMCVGRWGSDFLLMRIATFGYT